MTNNLEKFRRELLLSQGVVASHIGISRQALRMIEKGKSVPSLTTAFKLAAYFDTSVENLFEFEWDPNEEFRKMF